MMTKKEIIGSASITGAGVAIVLGGQAGATSIATSFGTASTGTAISCLTGETATKAAIAWLGGGALATGGGGIAAGNAVLTWIPIIGAIIVVVGIGYGGYKYFKGATR